MTRVIKVVEPSGILERESATHLQQAVLESVMPEVEAVLLDFSQVSFMSSSGLGVVATTCVHLREMGKELFLCSLNDQLRIIFELTAMDACFEIFANRTAFEQQLRQTSGELEFERIEPCPSRRDG